MSNKAKNLTFIIHSKSVAYSSSSLKAVLVEQSREYSGWLFLSDGLPFAGERGLRRLELTTPGIII